MFNSISDSKDKYLTIGTDCSGTEAPIQALQLLNIKYDHIFSSDNDKFVKQNIKFNFKPRIFFDDIKIRDHSLLPKLDIYVCGFPCQSFSSLGKRLGFDDKIKGTIFFDCFNTIKSTTPTVFILENVKGLINHDKGNTFRTILDCLFSLGNYNIYYKILNTKNYGIPQNRERIYIVGIDKQHDNGFKYPEPIPLKNNIIDLLDNEQQISDSNRRPLTPHMNDVLNELVNIGKIKDLTKPWIVNLNVSSARRTTPMLNLSPTLLAGNGSCIFYLTSHHRYLTPTEYMKLQGFNPKFISIVGNKETYKQAGNAMSVNVLYHLFNNIFKYVNFV